MCLEFAKKIIFLFIFMVGVSTAYGEEEADYRSITQLKTKGFTTCAGSQSTVTKWLYDKDDFAFFGLCNISKPDVHTATTLAAKRFSDTTSVSVISTSPTVNGACDSNFVHIIIAAESCPKLRDTTFKDWKFFTDLGGTPVYSDPTSESVSVILVQNGEGCLIVKQGSLFFPAEGTSIPAKTKTQIKK